LSEKWQLCELEVLECKEVPWPDAAVEAKNCIKDCGWSPKEVAYECKVKLLTGRTHQVSYCMHCPFLFCLSIVTGKLFMTYRVLSNLLNSKIEDIYPF